MTAPTKLSGPELAKLPPEEAFQRIADVLQGQRSGRDVTERRLVIGKHLLASAKTVRVTIPEAPWRAPTLKNGWLNYGAGSGRPNAGYRIDENGRVWLRGFLKSGTINTAAFTLPAGYRPIFPAGPFVSLANDVIARFDVETDGDVIVATNSIGSNTWFSIPENTCFLAASPAAPDSFLPRRASGTVTAASVLAADTVTINGVVFTAQAAEDIGAAEFSQGGTDTQTAASLVACINGSTDAAISGVVKASNSTGVVTITTLEGGEEQNDIALASSNGTRLAVSGETLSGGGGSRAWPLNVSSGLDAPVAHCVVWDAVDATDARASMRGTPGVTWDGAPGDAVAIRSFSGLTPGRTYDITLVFWGE